MASSTAAPWSSSLNELVEAIRVLYRDPDPERKKAADIALKRFQRSREAWSAAHALLQPDAANANPSAALHEVKFFAASTLADKVFHDYAELPAEQRLAFRDAVLTHLQHHIHGARIILTQLSMAIASLAVQMDEWTDPTRDLVRMLAGESGIASTTSPEMLESLLHILEVLPDECSSKRRRLRPERVDAVINSVVSHVLAVLSCILHNSAYSTIHLRALRCLRSWIRNGCNHSSESALLSSNLVLGDCIHAAATAPGDIGVISADILTEACILCENGAMPTLSSHLLASIPDQLWPAYEKMAAKASEDHDAYEGAEALLRLFSQLGESFIARVMEGSADGSRIIALMSKAQASPDPSLSVLFFNFWYILSLEMGSLHRRDPSRFQAIVNAYASQLYAVIDILRELMRFPSDYDQLDAEERDERKKFRYQAADALLDVSSFLDGSVCLQRALEASHTAFQAYQQNPGSWQPLEACLYSIRSMARSVDMHSPNTSATVLPRIMSELLHLPAAHPLIRYTATMIIGRYSEWVGSNTQYLSPLLQFVLDGFSLPDVAASAAMSFKFLCLSCGDYLAQNSSETIMRVYDGMAHMDIEDQREIIEGVCAVVTRHPQTNVPGLVHHLLEPVVHAMNAAMQQPPQQHEQTHQCINLNLDRLAHIFKSLHSEPPEDGAVSSSAATQHPLASSVQALWPLLSSIATRFSTNEPTMEKLCRLLKSALRSCGLQFPVLAPLCETVTTLYQSSPFSCFLYTISVAVDEFAERRQDLLPMFAHILNVVGPQTFLLLKDTAGFCQYPDVADDYFNLLSRYLKSAPSVLFESTMLSPSFVCAIGGLRVDHREAADSVQSFLRSLIDSGCDLISTEVATQRHILESLLSQNGQALTDQLIQSLQDDLPRSRIRAVIDLLKSLLGFSRAMCSEMLPRAVATLPETITSRHDFVARFLAARSSLEQREAVLDLEQAIRADQKRARS